MQTTVPSVKSLLVRARIGLAESGQARLLTCDEVQLDLAEAAEGIGKVSGPARKHVRDCDGCKAFRNQLRSDRKAMAALFPVGLCRVAQAGDRSRSSFGGGSGRAAGAGAGAGAAGAVGGASAAGGISGVGILGGAIGAKAAAGFATAAILTAGAVEVRNIDNGNDNPDPKVTPAAVTVTEPVAKPIHVQARLVDRVAAPAPVTDPPASTNDRTADQAPADARTEAPPANRRSEAGDRPRRRDDYGGGQRRRRAADRADDGDRDRRPGHRQRPGRPGDTDGADRAHRPRHDRPGPGGDADPGTGPGRRSDRADHAGHRPDRLSRTGVQRPGAA